MPAAIGKVGGSMVGAALAALAVLFLGACAGHPDSTARRDRPDTVQPSISELARRFEGRAAGGFSTAWCPAFLQALREDRVAFVAPVFETNDGNAPELSEYNRCRDKTFWNVQAGGWEPNDTYLRPGRRNEDGGIVTSDIQIIPWNLRYLSVVPDIGHRNFKLYRLPDLHAATGETLEVIYGEVDRELDKTNTNFLRLSRPGTRYDSGYWVVETKQCYAKWRDVGMDQGPAKNQTRHAIVQYDKEHYVLKIAPSTAAPWVMDLELVGRRKKLMSEWWPCRWVGDIR